MISAVIFDAFGTLVRIGQRTNPYSRLFREGRRQACEPTFRATRLAMTMDLSLDDFAEHLEVRLTPSLQQEINDALELELASISPFPDAHQAITRLQNLGLKVGVCSNLSAPFGPVLKNLFPSMDAYAISYQIGAMKPEPEIYRAVCNQIGVQPGYVFEEDRGRVLMIGDSKRCDQDGPRAV